MKKMREMTTAIATQVAELAKNGTIATEVHVSKAHVENLIRDSVSSVQKSTFYRDETFMGLRVVDVPNKFVPTVK